MIMGGRRTGLIRARKAAYYTQESLAYALNVDPTTVGHWERGRSEPLPYKRPKLAKLLGVDREQLEELLAEGQAEPSPAALAEQDGELKVADVASDPMKRRTLMKWGVATTAASGLGIEAFGQIGVADVRRLERTTDRLCNLDHRHGGETLWRAGAAAAEEAAIMLEQGRYSTSVGQALLGATGNLHIRTGWLACDAGRHDVARTSFTEALTISRQAGDPEIETRALAGLGFHSNLVGRPREGLRFSGAAEDAVRRVGPSSRMTAVPLLHLAVANARSDDYRDAQAAISRARKALDADRGEEAAPWAAFMTPMEIDAVEATCAVEVGQSARAEQLLEQAIAGYGDGFARNIALYRVRLAAARVQAGAIDGATEAADDVLDTIAAGLDSWRVSLELGRVMDSLEAYPGAPGVQALKERYATMITV
ncbi:helix-turn-helix transcriptional regulator [Amycolatopsis sp. cmx-4-68]|uniref:helix-turn-helix transcriptional regulator n=1 Tax=Amycolatopsis sp. cmx-4-68 TaxID=2790938 RepID=UPI00397A801D